jgi:hypothetical protein
MAAEDDSGRRTAMLKRTALVVAAVVLAAATVHRPAEALGGWASIGFETPMPNLVVAEPVRFGLMVKQHGTAPIHYLHGGANPIEIQPVLTAKHIGGGQVVTAAAVRDDKTVGRYTVDLTFPVEGRWQVHGTPRPFGEVFVGDLTVGGKGLSATDESSASKPALAAAPKSDSGPRLAGAGIAAAAVVAAGALGAGAAWQWRRRRGSISR